MRAKCFRALLAGGVFRTARARCLLRFASMELLCRPRLTRCGGSLASIVFEASICDLKVLRRHIPGKSLRGFLVMERLLVLARKCSPRPLHEIRARDIRSRNSFILALALREAGARDEGKWFCWHRTYRLCAAEHWGGSVRAKERPLSQRPSWVRFKEP